MVDSNHRCIKRHGFTDRCNRRYAQRGKRANLRNRTRQPKGCADRIAKPARLGRTSQNHLMMIILNKTGATAVAQLKTTGTQQCNNAKTALFQRFLDTVTAIQNLLLAAFGVSTRDPAALLFAPGGHSPTGGRCMCDVGTFVRLCFGVSCGIARARTLYAIVSTPIVATSCMTVAVSVVHGRRVASVVAVAVASRPGRHTRRAVAVTWRRGFCVTVVRLRHANEC